MRHMVDVGEVSSIKTGEDSGIVNLMIEDMCNC